MKDKLMIYNNGATVRLHNRRICFKETDDGIHVRFDIVAKDAEKPSCFHVCHKGKVRVTHIKISAEGMEYLVESYLIYKKEKDCEK
jgi:hypothetical protein